MGRTWGRLPRYLGVRVSDETFALLEAHAKEHHVTVSAFARQALEQAASREVCTWIGAGNTRFKYRNGKAIVGVS